MSSPESLKTRMGTLRDSPAGTPGTKNCNNSPTEKKGPNKEVFLVFLVLLVDLIAFTIILPLLPSLLDYYETKQSLHKDSLLDVLHNGMNTVKDKLQMPSERQYNNVLIGGILGSLFSTLQFVTNPLIGFFSDVCGRKPVLLISMAGTLVSYIIWMQAETFTIFMISRIIGGLSKGSVTVCTALMADLTSKETRWKAMALIGVAFSVGFSIGPLVGAFFATKSKEIITDEQILRIPPLMCICLQFMAMLLAIVFLREPVKESQKQGKSMHFISSTLDSLNPLKKLSRLHHSVGADKNEFRTVWRLGIIQFLYLVLFSGLEFTLTFLTHQRFHFTRRQQGLLFLFIGVTMSLTQGGYVRRVKHGKERRVALQGIFVLIPSMMVVAFCNSLVWLYFGIFLYSFGAATVIPSLTTLVSNQASSDDSGEILGIFRSLGALARAIGPLLTCTLYWSVGSKVCYFIGGWLFLVPLFLLSKINERVKTE